MNGNNTAFIANNGNDRPTTVTFEVEYVNDSSAKVISQVIIVGAEPQQSNIILTIDNRTHPLNMQGLDGTLFLDNNLVVSVNGRIESPEGFFAMQNAVIGVPRL